MRRRRHAALALLGAMLLSPPAAAGNLDGYALGNEAALVGGAVVATTRDPSAAWYNPAGLGRLDRDSLDGSASLLVWRRYVIPHALVATFPDGSEKPDASSSALISVPVSLAVARSVSPTLGVAAGLFVQREDFLSGQATMNRQGIAGGQPYRFALSFDLTEQAATYYAGGGIGWQPSSDLRIGISLFIAYRSIVSFEGLALSLTNGSSTPSLAAAERKVTLNEFGVRPTAGVQWEPVLGWEVGATLQSPLVVLAATRRASGYDGVSGGGLAPIDTQDGAPGAFDIVQPWRAHVALARRFAHGFVAFGMNYEPALYDGAGNEAQASVTNLQLGGRAWLSPTLGVGAGVFTDRSLAPGAPSSSLLAQDDHIATSRIDFVGASAGIEYRRRYDVLEQNAHRGLEFSTTLALRYAYGRGTIYGLSLAPFAHANPLDGDTITVPASIHEFQVHIGSALYF